MSKQRSFKELWAIPRPRNIAEFEVVSAWYHGIPLHIRTLRVSAKGGFYEIEEPFDSYHGVGWPEMQHRYDYARAFLEHAFGRLGTGGTAARSYGDFRFVKPSHREELRLKNLQDSWRRKDAGRVRNSLARLAPNSGGGENTAILGSGRVLRDDRADGASTASLATGAA
jgi:hypothetical protein